MYRVVRVIAFLIAPVMSLGNAPAMCLADPPLQLQAGISEVSITFVLTTTGYLELG